MLGVELEKQDAVMVYMAETEERLKGNSILTNPFTGKIRLLLLEDKLQYLIDMTPVYPKVYMGGVLVFGIPALFFGVGWWLIPGVCIMALYFLWTKWFIYLALRAGLKKARYKGKVKVLSNEDMLNSLLF